jgi:DNA-binding response OmpR family regulator
MLVLSRDGAWLSRLEAIARRGGWPFVACAVLPVSGRAHPPERVIAVLDRALAGAVPKKAVEAFRVLYPGVAIVLAFDASEMHHDAVADAVSCGADEVLAKSWSDEKLSPKLAVLRDRSLAAQFRLSTDGALRAELRAHRALIRSRGRWKEIALDGGSFALLWLLLEREGDAVSRAELSAALAAATGRELETGTITRRLAALRKAISSWPGDIETARGGLYRIASAPRKSK